ncbi:potassium voltage-gated channel subfamily G member 2 isoform X1 [Elephas maximus indicus]|uniref:potassium voltage-gated channel subfamily G member 2 isoform X1 n=1 Tax=Elephas maximus indicus TaxID=99487 RepID=UPI0021165A62|nr:potassium voltage-gated channel subfamily G member 2 isoform X1 [Elephas maximus indicus]
MLESIVTASRPSISLRVSVVLADPPFTKGPAARRCPRVSQLVCAWGHGPAARARRAAPRRWSWRWPRRHPARHYQRGWLSASPALGRAGPLSSGAPGAPTRLPRPRRTASRLRRLRRGPRRILLRPQPQRVPHHCGAPARRQTAAAARLVRAGLPRRAGLLGHRRGAPGALLPAATAAPRRGGGGGRARGRAGPCLLGLPGVHPGACRAAGSWPEAPARSSGKPALGAGGQALRLRFCLLRGHHRRGPLPEHHAGHPRRGGAGRVLPQVPQTVRAGDGVRSLVLLRIPAALRAGREQVRLPADTAQHHRHPGHPALLRVAIGGPGDPGWARGRRGAGTGAGSDGQRGPFGREQATGARGAGAATAARAARALRDAPGAPLAGAAHAGADGAALRARARPAAALPLRSYGALRAARAPGRARAGRAPRLLQRAGQLLVGRHLHDHRGLRRHGAAQSARAGGGAEQHPQRHPAAGLPRHLHLPHLLSFLLGAQGAAAARHQPRASPVRGQHALAHRGQLAEPGRRSRGRERG